MSTSPPAWASFFDPAGWAQFLGVVANDLQSRGVAYALDGDEGCIRLADGRVLGLANLAQMCFRAAPSRWAFLVAHHLRLALAPNDTTEPPRDFGAARDVIKLRLWSRQALPKIPLVAWDIADDLVAVLTYDLPELLASVKRDDTLHWPVTKADLWHLALSNIRADGLLRAPTHDAGNGALLHVLEGDATYFAASHVLFLEAYAGLPPHGAVVAVPRRHTAIFHAITDLRVVDALSSMLNAAPRMCHEGPGSITASLYWWRPRHALMLLPARRTDTTVELLPPPEFAALLTRLPG